MITNDIIWDMNEILNVRYDLAKLASTQFIPNDAIVWPMMLNASETA
jgi:hypothetical protein